MVKPAKKIKVFISHSSKDKWAASRIAEDIRGLEAETFLDEKDLKTGESIDGSIRKHLEESDDFLILLSPASIKSEWVLIELGGAITLQKRIVPILLYVGANEMPQAINLKLARDINEVQKYYDELLERITGKRVPKKRPRKKKLEKRKFKIGDTVRIIAKSPPDSYRDKGLDTFWAEGMDSYLGQRAIITDLITENDYAIDIDDKDYAWASEWLIPDRLS